MALKMTVKYRLVVASTGRVVNTPGYRTSKMTQRQADHRNRYLVIHHLDRAWIEASRIKRGKVVLPPTRDTDEELEEFAPKDWILTPPGIVRDSDTKKPIAIIQVADSREAAEQNGQLVAASPKLLRALRKVREDINWMLNEQRFLSPDTFDYIEEAMKTLDTEGDAPVLGGGKLPEKFRRK